MEGEKVNEHKKKICHVGVITHQISLIKGHSFPYFSSSLLSPLLFPSFLFSFPPHLPPPSSFSVSLFDIYLSYIFRNNPVASHINVPLSYCNSDCNCDKNQWEPVCGYNGITYVSPCLAGCNSSSGNKKPIVSISFYFLSSR